MTLDENHDYYPPPALQVPQDAASGRQTNPTPTRLTA